MKVFLFLLVTISASAQYNELNQDSLAMIFTQAQSKGYSYLPPQIHRNAGEVSIGEIQWEASRVVAISVINRTQGPISNITIQYQILKENRHVDGGEFVVLPPCRYCLTKIMPNSAFRVAPEEIVYKKPEETIRLIVISYQ